MEMRNDNETTTIVNRNTIEVNILYVYFLYCTYHYSVVFVLHIVLCIVEKLIDALNSNFWYSTYEVNLLSFICSCANN